MELKPKKMLTEKEVKLLDSLKKARDKYHRDTDDSQGLIHDIRDYDKDIREVRRTGKVPEAYVRGNDYWRKRPKATKEFLEYARKERRGLRKELVNTETRRRTDMDKIHSLSRKMVNQSGKGVK